VEESFVVCIACDRKCGCSEAGKPRSLKSGEGELKPSSLIEVDTYGCSSSIGTVLI